MNDLSNFSNTNCTIHKEVVMEHKDYDNIKSASAQDCTGLIPANVQSEEELENYESLYPFLPQPAVMDTDSENI